MQNQIVSSAIKGLWQTIPGNIGKGLSGLSQQRAYLNGSPLLSTPLSNDAQARQLSMGHSASVLLPGGGLGKFQGHFMEEMYFNANDNKLLAQIPQSGYQITQKCKNGVPDWSEFERMANACSNTILLRQTAMLNKHRIGSEESFFLQEQKSILERILDILKNLAFNRRAPPPYGPYSQGSPYGPYYHQTAQTQRGDETAEKKDDNETSNEAENDNETESADKPDADETEAKDPDDTDERSDFGKSDWQYDEQQQHDSSPNNGHQRVARCIG